ncbi:secreted protein [Thioploca ingrica]|uniref:Secreted protein n=1 Tax=Thioploca ingrica TaxID=40754 RepID=A0A090ADP1_9GAMM|nr:secreted protein [Thioploca ingrica]
MTVPQQQSLDKQHFKETVTINDFAAEKVIIFSTINGVQPQLGTHEVVGDDNFLRGFLDKQSNKKVYQVYNVIYYAQSGSQSGWKQFKQARYQTKVGQELVAAEVIKKQEDCAALPRYGQCLYSEQVIFELDDNQVRDLAKSYSTSNDPNWQYELIPTSGARYPDKLLLAEIAGLVDKMDEYVISQQPTWPTLGAKNSRLLELLSSPESLVIPPRAVAILPVLNK